jgi:hypothetical protein
MIILYRVYYCLENENQDYSDQIEKGDFYIFIGITKNNIIVKPRKDLICFKVEVLETLKDDINKEDLRMREASYISQADKRSISRYTYNSRSEEEYRRKYNENKEKIKEYYQNNKDKLKKKSKERYEKLKSEYNKFIFGENVVVENDADDLISK